MESMIYLYLQMTLKIVLCYHVYKLEVKRYNLSWNICKADSLNKSAKTHRDPDSA